MEIELTPKAERQWARLSKRPAIFPKIEQALNEIVENPLIGKVLKGEFTGVRSHRVGDWRILYKVEFQRLMIFVINIANRKEAYR